MKTTLLSNRALKETRADQDSVEVVVDTERTIESLRSDRQLRIQLQGDQWITISLSRSGYVLVDVNAVSNDVVVRVHAPKGQFHFDEDEKLQSLSINSTI